MSHHKNEPYYFLMADMHPMLTVATSGVPTGLLGWSGLYKQRFWLGPEPEYLGLGPSSPQLFDCGSYLMSWHLGFFTY